MSRASLNLILSALLVGLIGRASGERRPYDYLILDRVGNEKTLSSLLRSVEENGGKNVEETADYFRKIQGDFVGAQSGDSFLKQLVDFFVELAYSKPDSKACSSLGVSLFSEIITVAFGSVENYAEMIKSAEKEPVNDLKLFNFLKHYGRETLKRCLSPSFMPKRINRMVSAIDSGAEFTFDKLMAMGKVFVSQLELIEASEKINFLVSKFNGNEMVKYMLSNSKLTFPKKNPPKDLVGFIRTTCNKISIHISDVLDSYNLGTILAPEATRKLILMPRFRKLNEYLRLCRQVQNPSTSDEASKNIIKNARN